MTPEQIKELRALCNLTEAELAKRLYVDIITVLRWEGGVTKPQGSRLKRLKGMLRRARKAAEPKGQANATA